MRDIRGLKRGGAPEVTRYEQIEWIQVDTDHKVPVSPDGEQLELTRLRAEVLKERLSFILPEGPLLPPP